MINGGMSCSISWTASAGASLYDLSHLSPGIVIYSGSATQDVISDNRLHTALLRPRLQRRQLFKLVPSGVSSESAGRRRPSPGVGGAVGNVGPRRAE